MVFGIETRGQLMHIELPREQACWIHEKVKSGQYSTASEVISEAIYFVQTHEEFIYQVKLEKLRQTILNLNESEK